MIATLNVPQDWQKIRLKRIANLNPSKSEVSNLSDDVETTFLPMEAISESWEVDYSRTRPLEEVRNGYTYFRDGDILIAKITPCFENGKGALVNGCLNGFGFGTTEFHVIRSPNSETTRFLSYVVRSHRFKVEGAGMMTGTAGQKRLSDDYVKDFEIFLPSLSVQGEIVRFLDRKTAAIDILIAKKQYLIRLLEEKRTALLNQAVTKGLNPNAPMKYSGIPWIGEIPEHWKVVDLRWIRRVGTSITYGIVQAGPHVEDGVPYIRVSDMSGNVFLEEGYLKTTPEIDAQYYRSKVQVGDLVIAIRAGIGKVLMVPEFLDGANLTQGTAKLSVGSSASTNFVYWSISSSASQMALNAVSKGATFREITLESLRKLKIAFPPYTEQISISDFLKEQTQKSKSILQRIQTQIEKLQEYRRSLITAAVTGKLDIKEEDAA